MPPLKALLISDGRPGHFSLSDGILAAIARLRPVDCHRLEVRRPRLVPARLLSTLTNRDMAPRMLLQRVYGIDAGTLPHADLIVSAGGDTLAANIAISRLKGGAPNLFYGSLRRYRSQDFALVLNSYARYASDPKYLITMKPSKLDADDLPHPGAGIPLSASNPPQTAGLLLGGDTPTIKYSPNCWQSLADFVQATHTAHGTRWIVSNSRRTPNAASQLFAKLAAAPAGPILKFMDVRQAGSGTLRDLFAASQAIAVTADSSSMLSEAIWVRRPVVALALSQAALPSDEQDYRTFLTESGWTAMLGLGDLTPQGWVDSLARLTPLNANPLDLLAANLKSRLPGLF